VAEQLTLQEAPMTQDEIIEMANKAFDESSFTDAEVLRFAKLVAEKEREACAMLCLWHNNTLTQNPTLFHMAELIRTRNNQ
jgi:hypothetical protein